jgi:ABC-type lipoprotein export system ATPase subunit
MYDATCEIRRTDRIVVSGRSGSGKTALLHLLAGLVPPASGKVSWPEIGHPADLRPTAVGIVFQGPSLIPSLDVVHNVALPLVLARRSATEASIRARAALDRLGIGHLATKMPDELSGGEAQRAAVARTLAQEPVLILADEPTGQLDHDSAGLVVDALIGTANEIDAALVVTTHDSDVAAMFPIRWQMADGQLDSGPVPCSA